MGTEVLRPQDCLNRGLEIPIGFYRRRCASQARNPPRSAPKLTDLATTHQKKQLPRKPSEDAGKQHGKKSTAKNPTTRMVSEVTILKRGQSLDSVKDRRSSPPTAARVTSGGFPGDLIVGNTERIGPETFLVPCQIGLAGSSPAEYAGTAFSVSPCPSTLPLPSFSVKKCFEDSAARDLRRLLRLD